MLETETRSIRKGRRYSAKKKADSNNYSLRQPVLVRFLVVPVFLRFASSLSPSFCSEEFPWCSCTGAFAATDCFSIMVICFSLRRRCWLLYSCFPFLFDLNSNTNARDCFDCVVEVAKMIPKRQLYIEEDVSLKQATR